MSQLKLYNYFRSSTSYRVRIALELKSLKYQYMPIHLLNNGGEQNKENYRAINPVGGVPTLEHDGKFISQSLPIIEYIDENFRSGLDLFPGDSFSRAKVRQICEIINSDIHPLQNLKVTQFLEKEMQLSTEKKQIWLQKWIGDGLDALEKTIAPLSGEFALADSVTAADLFIVPQLFSAARFGVDFTQHKNLVKINANAQKIEAFVRAHPFRQPDTPSDLRL